MARSCSASAKGVCRDELRLHNVFLHIRSPFPFTKAQWSRFPDWLFKSWKVILALYFISWLVVSLEHFNSDYPQSKNDKWMVYLTHWTYLLFMSYLLVSAINVCSHGVCTHFETTCHLWALKFQWLLWNIAAPATTVVVLLYWSILWPHTKHDPSENTHSPSIMNIHVHLLNGLILLLDQAIHAIPMRLLHVYQPVGYGALYAAFTGVYFAANGTDPTGQVAIYAFLDYRTNKNTAIGTDFGVVCIVIPVVWLFLWGLHKVRLAVWEKWDGGSPQGGDRPKDGETNAAYQAGGKEADFEEEVYTIKLC